MTVPLDSIQNYLILVHAFTTCFLNIYFNISLPSILMSSNWSLGFMFSILCAFLSSCLHAVWFVCVPSFDYINNIL